MERAMTLIRLDFHNSLLSVPTAVSLGNIGNFNFAHSLSKLFRVGPDLYTFVPNVNNNTLTRVRFAGCTSSTIPNSSLQNPPVVSYSQSGTYHINLIMDDGLSTQSSFCKVITVLSSPPQSPPLDSILCADSLVLVSPFTNTPNVWNDGTTGDTMVAKASGVYWVNTSFYGCSARDSFALNLGILPPFALGKDSSFCEGDSLTLQYSPGPGSTFRWQDGTTTPAFTVRAAGQYKLTVTTGSSRRHRHPVVVERPIDEIDARAGRTDLGMAGDDDATAFDRGAHRHAESRMDHRGAMLEVAADADDGGLGVGTQLRRACAERRERRFGEGSTGARSE